jgi:hypothetical protein
MMEQVLKDQESFVRWWSRHTWVSGDSPTPKISNWSKQSVKRLPAIYEVTEDDGPIVETSGIYCEVMSWVHLVVRSWSSTGGPMLQQTAKNILAYHFQGHWSWCTKVWDLGNFSQGVELGTTRVQEMLWHQRFRTSAETKWSFFPMFSMSLKLTDQVLKEQEFFMRW